MLIGVDAGGTSTRAVVLDESGRCVGYGTAGGGNPVSWGPDRAADAVAGAVSAALHDAGAVRAADAGGAGYRAGDDPGDDAGYDEAPPATVVLAMAGASSSFEPGQIAGRLDALGLASTVLVQSDLLATFCAGTPAMDGYALVAGTGAAAIRVRGGAIDVTADGLGWLVGDGGSGFWIGHQVVRAAAAALDGRGPHTALVGLVMDELGAPRTGQRTATGRAAELQTLIDRTYRLRPVELSRYAAAAFRAAIGGDEIATGILDEARRLLAATLGAVRGAGLAGPVVVGGGIARRLDGLGAMLAAAVAGPAAEDGRSVPEVLAVTDGVVGAAVLAQRAAGIVVTDERFARTASSIAEARARREG